MFHKMTKIKENEPLDKKDAAVLAALKDNARLSTHQISRKLRIPVTTVHNRIKKLEREGIIRSYTTVVDHKKLGRPLSAFILITVDYKLLKEIKRTQYELAQQLLKNPCVEMSAMLTGASDIILRARFRDMDELNDFITIYLRNVEGIEKTQTAIVLNEAAP